MQILEKTKQLLTNGEFLDIILLNPSKSEKIKNKLINFCGNSLNSEKCEFLRRQLADFGLKDFEIINLINIRPKGLIHLQIVIEEMSERLNEEQMNNLLKLFTSCTNEDQLHH